MKASGRGWRRLAPVVFVLVVAPITAEYLIGYDDTIGNPLALIFGVLFFGPLYGAPAVLIREITVRRRLGWATVLLLATAFGLIQAGLIDQSLFDPDYRHIPYWQAMRQPTFMPWAGTSAYMAVTFVAGHVFGSIGAPIALAQLWWPARSRTPWLGVPGTLVVVGLWGFGASFILKDQLDQSAFRISPGQTAGTLAVVVALVLLALTRRPPLGQSTLERRPARGRAPSPLVVVMVTTGLLLVRNLIGYTWLPVLGAIGAIATWLVVMSRWAPRRGWTDRHLAAVVTGDLLSIGVPAFATTPLGDVSPAKKLTSNAVLLGLVLALAARGYRLARSRETHLEDTPHETTPDPSGPSE